MSKMQAVLKFDFPEDEEKYEIYSHAQDYYMALCDMRESLRKIVKYSEHNYLHIPSVERKFYSILKSRGLEI
jgi:hypothetical protein